MDYTNFTAIEAEKVKTDAAIVDGIGDGFDKVVTRTIAADITLTEAEARARVFLLTSAAAKTVNLNMSAGKVFLVTNLGEYALTLTNGSGSATATANKSALFFCDGLNTVSKITADA